MRISSLFISVALLLTISVSCLAQHGAMKSKPAAAVSHELWNALLARHVSSSGKVDYAAFQKDTLPLNKYLYLLSSKSPDKLSMDEDARKAYWINAYNAFTVKLVLMYYPLSSIKDLGTKIKIPSANSPWDLKFIEIGNKKMTLNDIEHIILRKEFDDPRIHFAVNCASESCPVLRNSAYSGNNLEKQLDEQARIFVNDYSKNQLSEHKLKISQIWKWFEGDFTKEGDLITFLNRYSIVRISNKAKIQYLEYDWGLNQ